MVHVESSELSHIKPLFLAGNSCQVALWLLEAQLLWATNDGCGVRGPVISSEDIEDAVAATTLSGSRSFGTGTGVIQYYIDLYSNYYDFRIWDTQELGLAWTCTYRHSFRKHIWHIFSVHRIISDLRSQIFVQERPSTIKAEHRSTAPQAWHSVT